MPPHALVLSGSDRYADPWHPFPATSARVAETLEASGIATSVSEDVDAALAALADSAPDLLVLNLGAPDGPSPQGADHAPADRAVDAAARAGLLAHLAAGRPLLGLHVASTSLHFVPEWEEILGGIWVRGTTMHPDYGPAHIEIATDAHPIVAGVHDFDTLDERYSYLRTAPDVQALAWHEHDARRHPLLWARRYGPSRVVYDALGHDAASYDSAGARELVARSARWLLGGS